MTEAAERWVQELRGIEGQIQRTLNTLDQLHPEFAEVTRVLNQTQQARITAEKTALRLSISGLQSQRSTLQDEISALQIRLQSL